MIQPHQIDRELAAELERLAECEGAVRGGSERAADIRALIQRATALFATQEAPEDQK